MLESVLIDKVIKHYGSWKLEWVYLDPRWKKAIPDRLVMQKRDRVSEFTGKAGLIEFKCVDNFLRDYTVQDGRLPKIRADGREQQLLFVKNLLSNSCIVNYNSKVQLVEEYKWVSLTDKELADIPCSTLTSNLPSRLVLFSSCTLDNIRIQSIEDML